MQPTHGHNGEAQIGVLPSLVTCPACLLCLVLLWVLHWAPDTADATLYIDLSWEGRERCKDNNFVKWHSHECSTFSDSCYSWIQ